MNMMKADVIRKCCLWSQYSNELYSGDDKQWNVPKVILSQEESTAVENRLKKGRMIQRRLLHHAQMLVTKLPTESLGGVQLYISITSAGNNSPMSI